MCAHVCSIYPQFTLATLHSAILQVFFSPYCFLWALFRYDIFQRLRDICRGWFMIMQMLYGNAKIKYLKLVYYRLGFWISTKVVYVHIYYSHRRSSQTKHKSKWQHITWHLGNQQFTSVYYLPHPICTSRPHPTSQCMGTPRCMQYNTVQRRTHVTLFKHS